MKANPQLTPDMADKMRPMMAISFNVAGVVGTPILLLVIALFTWIVGRFFMGGALSYSGALLITAYAWFPKMLSSIIGMIESMVKWMSYCLRHRHISAPDQYRRRGS